MSFTKTVSIVASLASIFGVGVAGYKLAESSANTAPSKLDEKIMQLERQLEEVTSQKPVVEVAPPEPLIAPPPLYYLQNQ
jgi:hypothetical protein